MIGFAVVGCGGAGGRRVADLVERPGVRLRALCDSSPAICGALASAHRDALVTGDAERAINETGVDCVVIATPPSTHAPLATAALAAGRHVLVEKPLAATLESGLALARLARERGLVLHTAANHRHFAPVEEGRALCAAGALGPIRRVRARIGHDGARLPEWSRDPAVAVGGALLDNGIHLADLVAWWGLGSRRLSVRGVVEEGSYSVESAAGGRLEFVDGPTVDLWASWHVRGDYLVMALDGEEGSMWLRVGRESSLELRGRVRERRDFRGRFRAWERDLDQFLAEVRGAEPPGRNDGVAALTIVDALYRSAGRGPVDILLP